MSLKSLVVYFIVGLFVNAGYAQPSNDAGFWTTFTLQHSINKKLNVVLDQEFRLKENYQRINLFYTNFGIDYKFSKNLKISPTFRAIQKKQLNGTYSYRYRLMLDVTAKKKFTNITISERIRYQMEVQDFYTSKKGHVPEQFVRFKTELKYHINSELTPYYSCELRYQIRAPRGDGPLYNNGFHRVRNVIGMEYELNKKNAINLYYQFQTEFNISSPESTYVLGLAYTLEI